MIRIDLKPLLFPMLRGVPMPAIAILVGLVAGLLVWGVLEQIQSRQMAKIFGQELESRLEMRARESLVRFDQFLTQYAATTRLVANHRRLAHYLELQRWEEGRDAEPLRHQGLRPDWLPDVLERDGLVPPNFVLLVATDGRVREIYSRDDHRLPGEIAWSFDVPLLDEHQVQAVLTAYEECVYLVVSDALEDEQGSILGSLVVLVRVDEAFLLASQHGLLAADSAIALVNSDDQEILVSIDPDWLILGSPLDQWREDYLITSQSLPTYEGSDLNLLFTTLVANASVEKMTRHVRLFELRQRGIAALVFITAFTLVIYLVSTRLNKVLQRLSGFARRALEIEDPGFSSGANQLILLEDWVQQFTRLVLRAREEANRRHEIEMQESEALKAAIMEASLDSIVTLDRHGRMREINPTAERVFGYGRDLMLGESFSRLLLTGSARTRFYALLREGRRAQREGRDPPPPSELMARRADGTLVPVEVSVVPIQLEGELFFTLYLHDITQRKARDREIRGLAGFASESPNPMLRVSPGGRLLYANRASEPLLQVWREAGEPGLPTEWQTMARLAMAEGHQRDGEFSLGGLIYSCFFYPVKELGHINIYARDITAMRHAERELRRHQAELVHVCRLSTMGEMATGLAHELNQPLAAIANYASGCGRRLRGGNAKPEELAQAMDRIGSQAKRAGDIIRRLRALVGKQPAVRARVDLNHIVTEVRAFAEFDSAKLGLTIELDLAAEEIPVLVDLVQIEQVLLNLVRNALDALEAVPVPLRLLRITTWREAGWALTQVEDSGYGIAPDILARLFDPFFTTKQQGMGMGLAISQTILDNHEGEIRVESETGKGSRFQVRLPLAREPDKP